jgi:ABC-type transporter Mla subunit MlaD
MSDQDRKDQGSEPAPEVAPGEADAHQVFLGLLEESGFFKQINNLEESLKAIAGELQSFGENANERMGETENLAAHVLAMESILAVMLKKYPIDADDLKAEIKDASPTVQALAVDLVEKAGK